MKNKRIMSGNIEGKLERVERQLKEYQDNLRLWKKLNLIKIVLLGETISNASLYMGVNRKTGERYCKLYQKHGIKGLFDNYENCGKKGKLTDEDLEEIKQIIINDPDKNYSIEDAKELIDELYSINYGYHNIWKITRKILNLNYGKPFLKFFEREVDAFKHFKDSIAYCDLSRRRLAIVDETRIENDVRTGRVLYKDKSLNVQKKSGESFGANGMGFQIIGHGTPYIHNSKKGNAVEFVKGLVHFRIVNMINNEVKLKLIKAIENPNLEDENIINDLLKDKKMSKGIDMINEVNDKLYDDKLSESEKNKKLARYFNRRTSISSEKIRLEKERRLIENLSDPFIKASLEFDMPIDLILDNTKIHTANVSKEAMKILNIMPINLPVKCPDLSPIEDVWRSIKNKLSRKSYKLLNDLITDFKEEFYETIKNKSFYINWLKEWFELELE